MPGAEGPTNIGKPSYASTATRAPAPASAWGEPDAPIVKERRVKTLNIPHPELPHANYAPSEAYPFGSTEDGYAEKVRRQTVLEQHVNFWDRDNDGIIWPLDTFRGFRDLGYNLLWSIFAMFIIHVNFSFPTWPSWVPDLAFRIHTSNIHRTKHGSDTGAYDTEGRFMPQKYDEIFQKFSSCPERDGLSKGDLFRMIMAQRAVNDIIGLGGEVFEWTTTYILLWPADGIIRKEDVRACMDGSIFWKIARDRGVDLKGADPARTTNKH